MPRRIDTKRTDATVKPHLANVIQHIDRISNDHIQWRLAERAAGECDADDYDYDDMSQQCENQNRTHTKYEYKLFLGVIRIYY